MFERPTLNGSPCCVLSVPANRPAFFAKAVASDADTLMLDLEDAVFPDQKSAARQEALAALRDLDWRRKRLLVRINALDTQWGIDDLLLLASAERLDGVMLPKIETAEDIAFVSRLLERPGSGRAALELHILIETAQGVANVECILAAAPRLRSVTFGAGDYARSVADWSSLAGGPAGGPLGETPPLQLWAKARVANAAYAFGVTPIDGPIPAIAEAAARRAAEASRAAGFRGKWAIHPAQVPAIHEIFTPAPEMVAWAGRALAALDRAEAAGQGAALLDGRLVEAAHRAIAHRILAEASKREEH